MVDAGPATPLRDRRSEKAPVARLRAQLAGLEGAPAGAPPMQTRTFSQQRAALFARSPPHVDGAAESEPARTSSRAGEPSASGRPPDGGSTRSRAPIVRAAVSAGRCVVATEPRRQPQGTRRQLSPRMSAQAHRLPSVPGASARPQAPSSQSRRRRPGSAGQRDAADRRGLAARQDHRGPRALRDRREPSGRPWPAASAGRRDRRPGGRVISIRRFRIRGGALPHCLGCRLLRRSRSRLVNGEGRHSDHQGKP